MADYISREAAIEALRPYKVDQFKIGFLDDIMEAFNDGIDTAISELSVMPAADVVEVVRCSVCKHVLLKKQADGTSAYWCPVHKGYRCYDEFCNRGEPV